MRPPRCTRRCGSTPIRCSSRARNRSSGGSRRRAADDLERARRTRPERTSDRSAVYVLPAADWSRRVRGAFANELAGAFPGRAHAILTPNAQHGYTVSVRAPLAAGTGADALCRRFATGGGRAAAAGINHLPEDRLPVFLRQFERAFS